ncbi:Alkylmercury lyase [Clostridium collagenovorans DSM 3089]|uniref:Alkylmercury lyase n=2 Tax=Clostridium TaxID=1485 RepID=A0A1M5X9U2_9CLOT|nr:Alkylmercury lyase [Clostridium collagenovorans DSM 3089]
MNTIAKDLNVKNKCEYYTKEDNILRKAIMNFVIDNKKPFHIEKDLSLLEVDLNIESINESLENLKQNNGFVLNENNEAIFVYPVSALPTNHLVTLEDGRKFNAMCAIDAMGTAFTFNQNIEVKSKCSNTNTEISVEIVDGEIKNYSPSDLHVLHVDLNKYTDWGKNC